MNSVGQTPISILLPKSSNKDNLKSLLDVLSPGYRHKDILLEFGQVGFYTPGSLVAVLAVAKGWVRNGARVRLSNHKSCPAFKYLQRMDFFNVCGISVPEEFRRHDGYGKFVTIQDLKNKKETDIEIISQNVAACIAPDMIGSDDPDQTGFLDAVQYSVSEIALNALQHSRGSSYICAQFYPSAGHVIIGIADNGIGIMRSFEENGSPHCKPGMSHADYVQIALEPRVSSKTHLANGWSYPVNAGVGLTLVRGLALSTKGGFSLCSGNAFCINTDICSGEGPGISGTVCEVVLNRANVASLGDILYEVKKKHGLIKSKTHEDRFHGN